MPQLLSFLVCIFPNTNRFYLAVATIVELVRYCLAFRFPLCKIDIRNSTTNYNSDKTVASLLQAKGVDKTRRMFTGGEAINVIATNAIGHEVPIPVGLDHNGLRATAMLTPFVPGPLSVAINISNEPIPVSPLILHVEAGKVSAKHCTVIPVTKDYASESTQV